MFKKNVATFSLKQSAILHFFSEKFQASVTQLLRKMDEIGKLRVQEALEKLSDNLSIEGCFDINRTKLAFKMMEAVGLAIPLYVKKSFFPQRIKARLTVDEVVNFFTNVAIQMKKGGAFSNFEEVMDRYNQSVLRIKIALLLQHDARAIAWKPRNAFLFDFCYVHIVGTAHPALQLLSQDPDKELTRSDGEKIRAGMLLTTVFDALTGLVLPLTCADDIADYLQVPDLLAHFSQAFNVSSYEEFLSKDYTTLCSEFGEKFPHFQSFFKLYVELFRKNMQQLDNLVGKSAMEEAWPKIVAAWNKVMGCLSHSAEINGNLDDFGKKLNEREEDLAQNMLMTFFKVLEEVVIDVYSIPNSVGGTHSEAAQVLFGKGEVVGHGANHIATFAKEIEGDDFGNTILMVLASRIRNQQKIEQSNFSNFYRSLGYDINLEFATFSDFLKHMKSLNGDILRLSMAFQEDSGLDQESFANLFIKCFSVGDVERVIRERFENNSTVSQKMSELQAAVDKKSKLTEIIERLVQEPSLDVMSSFFKRVDSQFCVMDQVRSPITDETNSYVEGVERLFTMYLLCKTEV